MIWILAIRPKTLAASVCPVLLGTMLAAKEGFFDPLLFAVTLLTALGIQIGTNIANDYFDFLKGADTAQRKGPIRVTQAGLISPSSMRRAMYLIFFLTAFLGVFLILKGGFIIAFLLALSLLLGIIYTAGPYPLAYLGLGDIAVFLFFGPISVAGTYFLQTQYWLWEAAILGIGPGLISAAILVINNLRDVEEDRLASKKTLVVRFGKAFAKVEYLMTLSLGIFSSLILFSRYPFTALALLSFIPAFFLIRAVYSTTNPLVFNTLLQRTAQLLVLYTLLLCVGILL